MKHHGRMALYSCLVSIACAVLSVYCTIVYRFAVNPLGPTALSTDQILAALTLMVALVGLVVAVTGVGAALAAIFGFTEIRNITSRRTDEVVRKVILNLRKRGDITSLEAKTLLQSLSDEALSEIEAAISADASKGEEKEKDESALKKYPDPAGAGGKNGGNSGTS